MSAHDAYLDDTAFMEKIAAVIADPAFQRLKLTQHHNDSVYCHTLRVTYHAWRMGARWGADEEAILRGALFHDLYFHDWRDREHLLNHGWTHPNIALENARRHFPPLSELEENIISSHMWPFNIGNPPRSREAFIVGISDKLVATGEVILMFVNFMRRSLARLRA